MERADEITHLKGETTDTEPEGKGEGWLCHHSQMNPWFHFPSKVKASPK